MKPVRIFVSSPGDVGAEREKAREIFDPTSVGVQWSIAHSAVFLGIRTIAGAYRPANSDPPPLADFDLCVCLLWSRLGTRLYPGLHQKPDGGDYASGTEYELHHAMDSFRRSGVPEVFVYNRQGDPVIPPKPTEEWERVIRQYDALQIFFALR